MDDDGEYVEDMEDNEGGGGNMEMDNPEEDEDMFCEDDNNESKRSAIEFEIEKMLSKTNKEIFEEDLEVPDTVQKSRRFMKRKKEYTETYMTEASKKRRKSKQNRFKGSQRHYRCPNKYPRPESKGPSKNYKSSSHTS